MTMTIDAKTRLQNEINELEEKVEQLETVNEDRAAFWQGFWKFVGILALMAAAATVSGLYFYNTGKEHVYEPRESNCYTAVATDGSYHVVCK